jgi:hypothetical protein
VRSSCRSSIQRAPQRPDIKATANDLVRNIKQGLDWARKGCEAHNRALEDDARRAIEGRRERVLADHAHLDDVGVPVRKRGDAPTTYQAPAVRRKPAPRVRRGGGGGPYQLQAAITAVHDEAARAEDTDWPQILALYGLLEAITDLRFRRRRLRPLHAPLTKLDLRRAGA